VGETVLVEVSRSGTSEGDIRRGGLRWVRQGQQRVVVVIVIERCARHGRQGRASLSS
jgi:hypothetical protein